MANRFTGGVSINADISGLRQMQAITDPKLFAKAERNGLRAAGSTARTQIPKGIAQRYTIPSSRVKQDISKPWVTNDFVQLRLSRQPPTALQYRFKPGRRGGPQPGMGPGRGWGKPQPAGRPASMKVFRNRSAVNLPSAFLAPNGLPMLRVRNERGRGSLTVLHGPSIGQIYTGKSLYARELRSETETAVLASFSKAFEKTFSDAARGFGGKS